MDEASPLGRTEEQLLPVRRASGVETPFQSYPWLLHWVRHRGQQVEPRVLVVDNGETVAPFGMRRVAGLRVLEMLGSGDSDYVSLVSSRDTSAAWDSVIRDLADRRSEWDVLHLHSVRERDAVVAALTNHLGASVASRIYDLCPTVEIRGSWETFLAQNKKLRYEIRRWGKRLQEMGPVTTAAEPAPISDVLADEMVEVEKHSWKWAHGNASLRAGTQRDFLFAVLRDPEMCARVWTLRVGNELAAYAITLTDARRWYFYMTAYRQEYKNAGSFLLATVIESAHSAGCEAVALLRGDHEYKDAWATSSEPVYELVCAATVRGTAAIAAYRLRWWVARKPFLRALRSRIFGVGDRR